uniref:Uncharacterized protein n=1 Tax=Cannabis sativa TaxID=3483 RepID=A0A803PT27_CANSA
MKVVHQRLALKRLAGHVLARVWPTMCLQGSVGHVPVRVLLAVFLPRFAWCTSSAYQPPGYISSDGQPLQTLLCSSLTAHLTPFSCCLTIQPCLVKILSLAIRKAQAITEERWEAMLTNNGYWLFLYLATTVGLTVERPSLKNDGRPSLKSNGYSSFVNSYKVDKWTYIGRASVVHLSGRPGASALDWQKPSQPYPGRGYVQGKQALSLAAIHGQPTMCRVGPGCPFFFDLLVGPVRWHCVDDTNCCSCVDPRSLTPRFSEMRGHPVGRQKVHHYGDVWTKVGQLGMLLYQRPLAGPPDQWGRPVLVPEELGYTVYL